MPTTINGIGTIYSGRKNHSNRSGTCQQCGQAAILGSYDTQLYFAFVFIPIIPLGKKRIIDECSVCSRHFVADQALYDAGKRQAIAEAVNQYRAQPSTEGAILAHGQILSCHGFQEAAELRQEILQAFPNDAVMLAVLSMQLDQAGDFQQGTPLIERAYQLRPDLPETREGVALRRMADGRLDEARQLLSHLESAGSGLVFSLYPLQRLAEAYQRVGRHQEALQIANHVTRELPQAANDREMRRFIRRSEKALNQRNSIIPSRPSVRLALCGVVFLILLTGSVWFVNDYQRRHRTIHIHNLVNATVLIDGQQVSGMGTSKVIVEEGKHQVQISGPIQDEFELNVQTPFWQRWIHNPAWVVNVGGAAPLVVQTLIYGEDAPPSHVRVIAGERSFFVPHVDYLYEPAPTVMHLQQGSSVTKTRLALEPQPPVVIAQHLFNGFHEAARRFTESNLLVDPKDSQLLTLYITKLKSSSELHRAKSFMKTQLSQRPVNVVWHRQYQELFTSAEDEAQLIKDYDELLGAEPNSGALLYLRARLAGRISESTKLLERAIESDPTCGWPRFALSYIALLKADWAKAAEQIRIAGELGVPADDVTGVLHFARSASGEYDVLEQEYQEQLAKLPAHQAMTALIRLIDVRVNKNDVPGAQRALQEWLSRLPPQLQSAALVDGYSNLIALSSGDFATIEANAARTPIEPSIKFSWLVSAQKPEAVIQDPLLAEQLRNPWNLLALYLAFGLTDKNQAAQYLEQACASLDAMGSEERQVAAWLRSTTPPSRAEIDDVALVVHEKCLLLAAMSVKFPDKHADFSSHARQFLFSNMQLRHLIQRAIEAKT